MLAAVVVYLIRHLHRDVCVCVRVCNVSYVCMNVYSFLAIVSAEHKIEFEQKKIDHIFKRMCDKDP